jgi:hypothetical protein
MAAAAKSSGPIQVSFVVRIVPSPDWFVGIDSLDLCEGGRWKEQVVLDLYPHDAGTDSGFTFSSPNFATIPQDTVTEVSGLQPLPLPIGCSHSPMHRQLLSLRWVQQRGCLAWL